MLAPLRRTLTRLPRSSSSVASTQPRISTSPPLPPPRQQSLERAGRLVAEAQEIIRPNYSGRNPPDLFTQADYNAWYTAGHAYDKLNRSVHRIHLKEQGVLPASRASIAHFTKGLARGRAILDATPLLSPNERRVLNNERAFYRNLGVKSPQADHPIEVCEMKGAIAAVPLTDRKEAEKIGGDVVRNQEMTLMSQQANLSKTQVICHALSAIEEGKSQKEINEAVKNGISRLAPTKRAEFREVLVSVIQARDDVLNKFEKNNPTEAASTSGVTLIERMGSITTALTAGYDWLLSQLPHGAPDPVSRTREASEGTPPSRAAPLSRSGSAAHPASRVGSAATSTGSSAANSNPTPSPGNWAVGGYRKTRRQRKAPRSKTRHKKVIKVNH